MKKFFIFIVSFVSLFFVSSFNQVNAYSAQVEFLKGSVKVNESVDMTITIYDDYKNIAKNFTWSILIVGEPLYEVNLPQQLQDWVYTFTLSDEWVRKFENWLSFKKWWLWKIHIFYDESGNSFNTATSKDIWSATIQVVDDDILSSWEIEIVEPASDTLISSDSLNVSVKTEKNSNIELVLYSSWTVITRWTWITDNSWNHIFILDSLDNWLYTLIASLKNSDFETIAESKEVKLTVQINKPSFKGIKIFSWTEDVTWSKEIFPETPLTALVEANSWLKEVSIVLDNDVTILKEADKPWSYSWSFNAPKKIWLYDIDVTLVSDLVNKIERPKETQIWVIEFSSPLTAPEYKYIKILSWSEDYAWKSVIIKTPLILEVWASSLLDELYVIIDSERIKLKESEILWIYRWSYTAPSQTWVYDVTVMMKNSYWTWTFPNVTKLTTILLDPLWISDNVCNCREWFRCVDWECIPDKCDKWYKNVNWKCVVDCDTKKYVITNLKYTKLNTYSVLTWDPIQNATSYNIYKVVRWNQYELYDTVKETKKEIPITWEETKYEDFVVEAIINDPDCWISKSEMSKAVSIQTWPKTFIILLILALIIWLFFTVYKKQNA